MLTNTVIRRLKNVIKRGVLSRSVQGLGFTAIPTRVLDHYPAAVHTRRLLRLLDIDCVFDVGANLGQFRDFLRHEVGYKGKIISFEPIPSHAALLKARAEEDPNWTIHAVALGSTPGRATFNVMRDTQFSSFRQPDHSHVQMFSALNVIDQQVEVEVCTLDGMLGDIVVQLGPFSGIFLKLDTQGFDMEVISGARKAIASVKALQMEASVRTIYAGVQSYEQAIKELNRLGFELSGIYPNNPTHFPRLVEFDCYMISALELGRLGRV